MTELSQAISQEVNQAHSDGLQSGLDIAAERVDAAEATAQAVIDAALQTRIGQEMSELRLYVERTVTPWQDNLATAQALAQNLQSQVSELQSTVEELEMSMLVLMEAEEAEELTPQELTNNEINPKTVEAPESEAPKTEEKSPESSVSKSKRVFR